MAMVSPPCAGSQANSAAVLGTLTPDGVGPAVDAVTADMTGAAGMPLLLAA